MIEVVPKKGQYNLIEVYPDSTGSCGAWEECQETMLELLKAL